VKNIPTASAKPASRHKYKTGPRPSFVVRLKRNTKGAGVLKIAPRARKTHSNQPRIAKVAAKDEAVANAPPRRRRKRRSNHPPTAAITIGRAERIAAITVAVAA